MFKKDSFSLRKKRTQSIAAGLLLLAVNLFLHQATHAATPVVNLYFDSNTSLQEIEKLADENNTFRVKVVNFENQPIKNANVQWAVDGENIQIISATTTTNKDGYSFIQLNIPTNSHGILTAILDGKRKILPLLSGERYRFSNKIIKSTEEYTEANGVDATKVTVELVGSSQKKAVRGGVVNWTLESNTADATLSGNHSISNQNGKATIEVSATKTGTVTLVATIKKSISAANNDLVQSIDLSFEKSYTLGLLPITINKQQSFSNDEYSATVTAAIQDTRNQSKSNRKVFWQLLDHDHTGALLQSFQKATDQRGKITAEIKTKKPGKISVIATIYNNHPDKRHQKERRKATIIFKPDYHLAALAVFNDKAEANGSETVRVQAQLNNSSGKGYHSGKISWRLEQNSANAYIARQSGITDYYGEANAYIKASQAGSVIVRATTGSTLSETVLSETKKITFVKNYNVGFKSLTLDKGVARGQGNEVVTATATVVAANNKGSKENRQIVWKLEDNTIEAELTTDSNTTDAKGKAFAYITAEMEGSVTLLATVTDQTNPQRQEQLYAKVYFRNQASIHSLKNTATIEANSKDYVTITAHIVNEEGEPLKGQPISWSLEDDNKNPGSVSGIVDQ